MAPKWGYRVAMTLVHTLSAGKLDLLTVLASLIRSSSEGDRLAQAGADFR